MLQGVPVRFRPEVQNQNASSGFLIFYFMYEVYAIASLSRNYIYVGLTDNLERRLKEHNAGHNKTTKPYLPFQIIHRERCTDRVAARFREKYWKSGTGKEQLKILRANYQ